MLKPVKGYEGLYSVNEEGMVLGEKRGRYLKLCPTGAGYLGVRLSKRGHYHTIHVHVLVAEAFLEKPEGIVEVNHDDGNKWNNHLSNLEWMTKSENRLHAIHVLGVNFTAPSPKYGENHPNAKLTKQQVVAIRNDRESGFSFKELGEKYSIHPTTAHQICSGKTWQFQ